MKTSTFALDDAEGVNAEVMAGWLGVCDHAHHTNVEDQEPSLAG